MLQKERGYSYRRRVSPVNSDLSYQAVQCLVVLRLANKRSNVRFPYAVHSLCRAVGLLVKGC